MQEAEIYFPSIIILFVLSLIILFFRCVIPWYFSVKTVSNVPWSHRAILQNHSFITVHFHLSCMKPCPAVFKTRESNSFDSGCVLT